MNRNPLNQDSLNALSFTTILIVMGILLFLCLHPYSGVSLPSIFVDHGTIWVLGP